MGFPGTSAPAIARRAPSKTIGFGTAPIGGLFEEVEERVAADALAAAFDAGIRLFDTAPLYGAGIAERRLGQALAGRHRQAYRVSTKVGLLIREGGLVRDFTYDGVMRSVEESLVRVGIDRFDVLLVHDPADDTPTAIQDGYRALSALRDEKTVDSIGVGTERLDVLIAFLENTDIDTLLLPGRFTLLNRSALTDVLPACVRMGVKVITGGVFNSGILADPHATPMYDYRTAPDWMREAAFEMEAACARHDVPLAAAALQFAQSHPAVDATVVGLRSADEVAAAVALNNVAIPAALWDELDLLSSGFPLTPVS